MVTDYNEILVLCPKPSGDSLLHDLLHELSDGLEVFFQTSGPASAHELKDHTGASSGANAHRNVPCPTLYEGCGREVNLGQF